MWPSYINDESLPHNGELTEAFSAVGLHVNDTASTSYANIITNCFIDFYAATKPIQMITDAMLPAECTAARVFPNHATTSLANETGHSLELGISAAKDYVQAICYPRTLDPYLAGIGVNLLYSATEMTIIPRKVFPSFLIQAGIAILGFLAPSAFQFRLASKPSVKTMHTNAVITALVDFHKSQCYLLITIQVIAFIIVRNTYGAGGKAYVGNIEKPIDSNSDALNVSVLILLAISSFLPTTLTLTCISR